MRSAHLSDIHLGFRAFSATVDGRNAREVDVKRALEAATVRILELKPDLVTVAGDIVHNPRVSTYAVYAWRRFCRRLSDAGIRLVAIQGNHDAPRTTETMSPILLPDDLPGVHILTEPGRVQFTTTSGERVAVAGFPFVGMGEPRTYKLEPDPEADVNVLLIHAAVKSSDNPKALPWFYQGPHSLDVGREAERWDVIACGDFHEYTRLHPERPVFYSGSIERTSSNIWDETAPKGFVVCETGSEKDLITLIRFEEIPTRPMIDYDLGNFDLPPGASAEDLNGVLGQLLKPLYQPVEGAIVRFRVDAFHRSQRDSIDWALVRQLKAHCLHFYLDLRFATDESAEISDRRQARSLQEEATEFLAGEEEAVQECALGYLQPPISELEPEEVPA